MGKGAGHDLRLSEEQWERDYRNHKWKENEWSSTPRERGAGRRRELGEGRVSEESGQERRQLRRVEKHRSEKRDAQASALGRKPGAVSGEAGTCLFRGDKTKAFTIGPAVKEK